GSSQSFGGGVLVSGFRSADFSLQDLAGTPPGLPGLPPGADVEPGTYRNRARVGYQMSFYWTGDRTPHSTALARGEREPRRVERIGRTYRGHTRGRPVAGCVGVPHRFGRAVSRGCHGSSHVTATHPPIHGDADSADLGPEAPQDGRPFAIRHCLREHGYGAGCLRVSLAVHLEGPIHLFLHRDCRSSLSVRVI